MSTRPSDCTTASAPASLDLGDLVGRPPRRILAALDRAVARGSALSPVGVLAVRDAIEAAYRIGDRISRPGVELLVGRLDVPVEDGDGLTPAEVREIRTWLENEIDAEDGDRAEGLPCPFCDHPAGAPMPAEGGMGYWLAPDPARGRGSACTCDECGASVSLFDYLRAMGWSADYIVALDDTVATAQGALAEA